MTAIAAVAPSQQGRMALPVGMGKPAGVLALGNYPVVGNVHQNVPLTNLIVGYSQPGLIADQVFPVLPVVNESDSYYKFDKSPWFRREESLVADRTRPREVNWQFATDVYNAQRYGFAATISARERRNADNQLRLELNKTRFIKWLIQLDTEVRLASFLTQANTSGVTLAGTDQFDNATFTASGVPIERRFDNAKEAIRQATGGLDPNVVIIPKAVALFMKRDPAIRDLIKYTTNALVNGDLPDTLWGLKVYIPGSIYTTSPEGTAEASVTYQDVWGKSIRFLYVTPPGTEGIETPTAGYQFRLSDDNYAVASWTEGAGRSSIDYFECCVTQDMKLTMSTACYVITNAVS